MQHITRRSTVLRSPEKAESPKAVLGWRQGRPCTREQLDEAFTLRLLLRTDGHGNVVVQRWKLYAEAGLPRPQTSVWVQDDTLTIVATQTPLAAYTVDYDAKQQQIRSVGEVRLFQTPFHPPQRPLWDLADIAWKPARLIETRKLHRRRRGLPNEVLWDAALLHDLSLVRVEPFPLLRAAK